MERSIKHLFRINALMLLGLFAAMPSAYAQISKTLIKLVPSQYSLQFAGSMGFMSAGAGYANQADNVNLSIHYGYVPESLGGRLDILTAKLVYKPYRTRVTKSTTWLPVNPVAFVTYTMNDGFFVSWPEEQYPKDYYWWSSAFRLHAGLNSEFTIQSSPDNKIIKYYACYFEINSNDLYIVSYMTNRNFLSLYDIIKIGAGVKVILN